MTVQETLRELAETSERLSEMVQKLINEEQVRILRKEKENGRS